MAISLSSISRTRHASPPRIEIYGPEKVGKALDITTPIPTPTGFKAMGDLTIGDAVFDANGAPCNVLATTGVMYNRPCYRVTLSNGQSLIADESHLWRTRTIQNTTGTATIRTTLEILETLKVEKKGALANNHLIPWHSGTQTPAQSLPIDPYVLGVWLGDGSSSGPVFTIAIRDRDIIDFMRDRNQPIIELEEKNSCIRCSAVKQECKDGEFLKKLRSLDLIGNKHIPQAYLMGSYEQRLDLLRGLMDTDGYVSNTASAPHEFCNCNESLAKDVEVLLASLGIVASMHPGRAMLYGKDCGPKWTLRFYPPKGVMATATKFKTDRALAVKGKRKSHSVSIASIEPIDSVPVRCIQVSSKDGMFLAGRGYIPTHNSAFFAGCAVNGAIHAPAPKPIFIRTEDGLNGLDVDAFPLAEKYSEVIDAITSLAQEDHDYKTVVLDSADWLERLIHQHVIDSCPLQIKGQKTMETAHGGYGKAYGIALAYWREVLSGLDFLNKQRGMIIGVICHSQVVTFNDPLSEPFDKWETKLHKPGKGTGARDLLNEWADVIGFAQREGYVRRQDTTDGKQVARGVAPKGAINKLHLTGSPGFVAGNRYGLPDTISLSWSAFADALAQVQHPSIDSTN